MKRWERLEGLVGHKCDAAMILSGQQMPDMNLQYYSGIDALIAGGTWYYKFDGEPLLLLSDSGHKANCRKIELKGKGELYRELGKRKAKRIGVNFSVITAAVMRKLRKEMKWAKFVDISSSLEEMRELKDKSEIESIKAACGHARSAMRIAEEGIYGGATEAEVMASIVGHYNRKGLRQSFDPIVAAGRNGLRIHSWPTGKKIRKNETVIVDTGCRVNGYCSDMTRTFCVRPNPGQEGMLQLVEDANRFARENACAGMKAGELYGMASDFFGSKSVHWKYGLGHGVGLDIHESPSLAPKSEDILREGMAFTIEPGLAIPGVGGARWEDTGVLTRKGYKAL